MLFPSRRSIALLAGTLLSSTAAYGGVTANGVSLNGVSLNGVSLNGVFLNGVSLNGVSLNGVSLNGVSLNGVSLNGSELIGAGVVEGSSETLDLGGADFIGAEIEAAVTIDGTAVTLRIDDVRTGNARDSDVFFYTVSVTTDGASWEPLCGADDAGVAVEAVALAGRWDLREGVEGGGDFIADPAATTFGCVNAALGKCVLLGYKPWAEQETCTGANCTSESLASHHQSCTRMIRADYCGDGTSHTHDGTPINIYDVFPIQRDAEQWGVEALWQTDGAVCVYSDGVYADHTRVGTVPSCYEALLTSDCGHGTPLKDRVALLVSEVDYSGSSGRLMQVGGGGRGPGGRTDVNNRGNGTD